MSEPGEITELLRSAASGNADADSLLMNLLYRELRKIAVALMRKEKQGHTLQPTALVHEAYLRLLGETGLVSCQDRGHFLALAARAMRQILVDSARYRQALKRGGDPVRVELDNTLRVTTEPADYLLDVNEALERLQALDARQAQLVEFRFFAGMTEEEIAAALGVSVRTVRREWQVARAWLHAELKGAQRGRGKSSAAAAGQKGRL